MRLIHAGWLLLFTLFICSIPACGDRDAATEQDRIMNLSELAGTSREATSTTSTTTTSTTTSTAYTTGEILVTGLSHPAALTLDDSGNIYVANRGDKTIRRVDGSRNLTLFASPGENFDVSYDADFGIFCGTATGVNAYGLSQNLISVATGTLTNYVGPALFADNRVFTASMVDTGGVIYQISNFSYSTFANGSSAGITSINDIISDPNDNLYVTSGSSIFKITSAGVITRLTTGLLNPQQLSYDNSYLYVAEKNGGRLTRVGVSAGDQLILLSGLDSPSGIAVKTGYLYWTTDLEINGSIGRALLSQLPGGQS